MNIWNVHSQVTGMTVIASLLAIGVIMIPLALSFGMVWVEDKINRRKNE
jgi:hypothetical protein|tara:strand:- start:478 stop:624 length:147 start_codon:yes stop_codon:yes gene_type:complete